MLRTKQDFATALVIVTICASPFLVMLVHDRCAASNAVAEEEARIAKAKAEVAEAEARAKAEPPWREKTLEEIRAEGDRAKALRHGACVAAMEDADRRWPKFEWVEAKTGGHGNGGYLKKCDQWNSGSSHTMTCYWRSGDDLIYSETYRWNDGGADCSVSSFVPGAR